VVTAQSVTFVAIKCAVFEESKPIVVEVFPCPQLAMVK
jgi:hypothetical protein